LQNQLLTEGERKGARPGLSGLRYTKRRLAGMRMNTLLFFIRPAATLGRGIVAIGREIV
jgi:hypothetical protein